MNQNTKRRWLAALLGAAAGMMVFFLLYGTSTLHPTYDAWILNGYDEWDIQQHYAGWVLFRNSHWAFPLGLADTIAAPDGTVISFTDSIPWVSIFFKALRGGLPSTFQWFGWYTLFCFAMQGAAGALLCARGQAKTGVGALVFSTLGGLLFVMLPTLWERAFRHTALASQWLFLLALYAFLEYRQNLHSGTAKFPWAMPVLAFLAVGIHPYFLPLVMMCALLAAVELGRQKKAWGRAALQFAASLAAAVVGGVLCGAIGSGTGASRSGYGDYSMNLNALINPTSRGGYTWSRLYQVMPQQPGQYDGFNYLGLGVLALITAALLFSLRRAVRCPQNTKTWWHRNGPVFAACVFLTLFAVSNKIYWGNTGIELPLPAKLLELCGIFRSSGRMFYLVAACMVVYAVYTLRDRLPGRYAVLVLALFVGVQAFDLSAAAQQKRQKFADPINATVVNNDQTASLGAGHTQLLAAGEVREDRLRLKLDVKTNRRELFCEVDRDMIRQAIINLMSNALRYTPEDGYVVVSVAQEGRDVLVAVADTGIGIAKEDLARVFSRFWRSDASRERVSGGLGVGLAVTKEIIDRHHGFIGVESELGKGTKFTLHIPRVQERAPQLPGEDK